MSNTSPIIALTFLGDLELIWQIFRSTVWIPPAVGRELGPRPLPPWVQVRRLALPITAQILHASLGAGESEALSLALEIQAEAVCLDDRAARRLASMLGLPVLGTFGILQKAKAAGLIPSVRPKLEQLRTLPFHIAPSLYRSVLVTAGELDE